MSVFTLFTAHAAGCQTNTIYPYKAPITSAADLEAAARTDHVAAEYLANQRSSHGFVSSDCLVMDIDNDHTEDPADWVTPQDLAGQLADVEFMTATSRNHNLPKGVKAARPRFHVYFPIQQVTDPAAYAGLKKSLADQFTFFDPGAVDAARFLYGHPTPQVETFTGTMTIDQWLTTQAEVDAFAAFDAATMTIGEGSRNATLSRFAGRVLIRYGNGDQARALFDRKAALCDPPLPQAEVEAIWRSATKFASKVAADPSYISPAAYQALTSLKPDDYTDVGQAEAMATEYADKIRYSMATHWLVYDGGVWVENDLLAQAVAQELTTRQLEEAQALLEQASTLMADTGATQAIASASSKAKGIASLSQAQQAAYQQLEDATAYYKFVLGRRRSANIAATLKEAQPLLEVRASELDSNPYLLCTPQATFDLREGMGSARDNTPADLITLQTAISPSDAGRDLWEQALAVTFQGDNELIGYVQRVCGLAAIGKVMLEALIIAYGDGRNGKSTFWNTIARVLGTYSGSISADTLTIGVRRNVKPELAEARGKRLLIAAETEEGVRLSTSNVKQLASTDKIAAEKKFKDPFSFTPSHSLVLYTNHLPRVGAMDAGIWRRLIVIPFNATITGAADVKNYADHLFTHAGGAILAWIMEGARLIHAENYHLDPPTCVLEASMAYREENDWFSHFLADQCVIENGSEVKAGELYQAYRAWALSTSGWARPMVDFNAACETAGFQRKKTRAAIKVFGLRLKDEFED
ncbi:MULTISPECIES: phage/plasmid primase, P4 family [Actinomycetaceae]|uniref:P4 family phage/plasmid primase-like protein n=1 Tax=Trueperella abortisuis TaxID=445930 RepID=A0ABT9PJB0_9ACTO|nr:MULTISPECIES: phage/plasmid primase, P4 family [Actinomycetaceae]MCI7305498.1 phage/plasmid primase, P4 family [Trueperella sp.]MCI7456904.1 phage/plasmid primase, P4 family [Actinomyces urogenitalis]MDP9832804.1 P4 family phage/plasmid primase-like protein [Trueperella abortisuis]